MPKTNIEETETNNENVEETKTDDEVDSQEVDSQEVDSQEEETQEDDNVSEWDPAKAAAKIKRINAENRKLRERAKQAEEAAGSAEDATSELDTLTATNESLQAQLLKYQVAYEIGLPKQLVNRLTGSTKEELMADAANLVGLFQSKTPPTNRPSELSGGARPGDSPRNTADLFAESFKTFFGESV